MSRLGEQSLIICRSVAEATVAGEIGRYLKLNCSSVAVHEDVIMQSGEELFDSLDFAISVDVVLLLLSPDSTPAKWPSRQDWEAALCEQPRKSGTALAFILVRPCRFPEILRKEKFFDLSVEPLAGFRKLKRWLLEHNPQRTETIDPLPSWSRTGDFAGEDIAELERQLGDMPGRLHDVDCSTALAFAHSCAHDFEGVIWVECFGRSTAGVIGDTAHALGLKLEGPTTQNCEELRRFCADRRCLFVFEQLALENRDLMTFEGRASVIFTAILEQQSDSLPLGEMLEMFSRCRTDPRSCLPRLRDAGQHLRMLLKPDCPTEIATAVKKLGGLTFRLLQQQGRLAEADEVIDLLYQQAKNDGDDAAIDRWEREKVSIADAWGQPISLPTRHRIRSQPTQLSLDL